MQAFEKSLSFLEPTRRERKGKRPSYCTPWNHFTLAEVGSALCPAPSSNQFLALPESVLLYLTQHSSISHDGTDMHAAWHQPKLNFVSVNEDVPVTAIDSWQLIVLCSILHNHSSEVSLLIKQTSFVKPVQHGCIH